MAKGDRISMMQKAQAKLMRKKGFTPHRETPSEEAAESPAHEARESPAYERAEHAVKFKRGTGSISSAGAAVGGAGGGA